MLLCLLLLAFCFAARPSTPPHHQHPNPKQHFLNHEDIGCMKVLLYQCPGYNDTQPAVCNFQFPIPGTAVV
jgi:hypothetical protein